MGRPRRPERGGGLPGLRRLPLPAGPHARGGRRLAGALTLQGTNAFSLLAIPFFIMTGQLLGAGGLANRIVDFANLFVGRLPGGSPSSIRSPA
ncbi:MAG: TRAP transporter large permease subunit [Desulfobacterales bacterium]|nr:TRAP transporter large permease subunit [Desulfobacterales bacterium]